MDSSTVDAMQGVLSINLYVQKSKKLDNFKSRWKKRFYQENPSVKAAEPGVFGLWAYDTVWALAMAAESAGLGGSIDRKPNVAWTLIKWSQTSPFDIKHNAQRTYGITKRMDFKASLGGITWPGDTMIAPKGLDWQTSKLRIGIPVKSGGISEFVNQEWNPLTQRNASGFSIEVFDMVMASLPYVVPYEYIPYDYEDAEGKMKGSYDDLVYEVYLKNFDAVVGDVTITPNRSLYVDFTAPYTEMGMSMVVPIKHDRKNKWFFFKPLTTSLWLVSGAFFIFVGFVVRALEHGINEEFKGPLRNRVGTIFYLSFSTLVFAHSLVFPKGSPLVPDISRAILKMTGDIEQMLYRNRTFCPDDGSLATSEILSLDDFSHRWNSFHISHGRLVSISKLFDACSSLAVRKSEQSVLRSGDEGNEGCPNDNAERGSPSSPSDRVWKL
ncbi:hypothetical protein COCNU_06G011840 [Cocos nucifera]|uniref:Ionotropic glutamate receptor C-terminal domain-containing protein n=1 Tax=Cocos nucifera TaxID=13894 RepID=A0A8K0ICB0_COCNU|nr:hypothetical protein COCNU_06G011840 [Cocos nucifera]